MQDQNIWQPGLEFGPDGWLNLELRSTQDEVRITLERVRDALTAQPVAVDPGWEIVLAEVLNNIVEHAFVDAANGKISVDLALTPSGLAFRIEDAGRRMPGLVLPAGDLPDLDVALGDLPEGGFGWYLIRSLTRDLHYERAEGRNLLRFTIPSQA